MPFIFQSATAASCCLTVIYYHPCYPSLPFYSHSTINQGARRVQHPHSRLLQERNMEQWEVCAPQVKVDFMSEMYNLKVIRFILPSGQILCNSGLCWIIPLWSCLDNFYITKRSVMLNRLTWLLTAVIYGLLSWLRVILESKKGEKNYVLNYKCFLAAFLRGLEHGNTGGYINVLAKTVQANISPIGLFTPVWHGSTLHLIY